MDFQDLAPQPGCFVRRSTSGSWGGDFEQLTLGPDVLCRKGHKGNPWAERMHCQPLEKRRCRGRKLYFWVPSVLVANGKGTCWVSVRQGTSPEMFIRISGSCRWPSPAMRLPDILLHMIPTWQDQERLCSSFCLPKLSIHTRKRKRN